ncbi:MAG: hypothetical protein ABI347_07870 [Nitrososphaera sp.]|jgi:hypothetical protein
MTEIHWMLLATGYQPRSRVSEVIRDSITRAFELLGESCSGMLINHLSRIYNLPPHVMLARYDLVGKAIGQVFGYGSEVFLHQVRENILEKLPVTDRLLPPSEIIKNAYKTEVVSFLRSINHEYAVLLYNSHSTKEELLRAFSRDHISASGFVNTPNGLEMLSYGGGLSCTHPAAGGRDSQACRSFLCSFGIKEASQNFHDIVLPHSHVITDEPFMVYARH